MLYVWKDPLNRQSGLPYGDIVKQEVLNECRGERVWAGLLWLLYWLQPEAPASGRFRPDIKPHLSVQP